MFLVVTAVASPLLGRAYDEWADRDLLTASMVLLAAGWLAVYLAPRHLARDPRLRGLHGAGAAARCSSARPRRSRDGTRACPGLALGIAYAGPGIGVAIALPIAGGPDPDRRLAVGLARLPGDLPCRRRVRVAHDERPGHRRARPAHGAAPDLGALRRARRRRAPASAVDEPPSATRSPASHRSAIGEPLSAGQPSTRATEAGLAARASGLHETSAPGAVSAAHEIPPVGSGEHRAQRPAGRPDAPVLAPVRGRRGDRGLRRGRPAGVHPERRPERARRGAGRPPPSGSSRSPTSAARSSAAGSRIGSGGGSSGVVAAVAVAGGVVAALGLVASAPGARDRRDHRSTASGPGRRSRSGRRPSATSSAARASGRSSGCSASPTRSAARSRSTSARSPSTRPAPTWR